MPSRAFVGALLLVMGVSVAFGGAAESAPAPAGRSMAVTIDDLPFVARGLDFARVEAASARLLDALEARGVPAIGFVNEDKLLVKGEIDARVALLETWLSRGFELGNHNFGHVGLTETPLAAYQDAVVQGEVITRWLAEAHGKPLRWYRHPYTQTGTTAETRAAIEAFLAGRGYRVAPFTIETSDWLFNADYVKAVMANESDRAEHIRRAYIEYTLAMTAFFEGEAQALFGRDIAQILLVHTNLINADALGEILDALARRGYRFIGLDAAMQDPAYQSKDGYFGRYGPSWLHRWRAGQGGDARDGLRREPATPEWLSGEY